VRLELTSPNEVRDKLGSEQHRLKHRGLTILTMTKHPLERQAPSGLSYFVHIQQQSI
jgi:hypothetical protein